MSTLQTTAIEETHAPYRCSHCGRWCDAIQVAISGGLMVIFHAHESCNKILSCQVTALPQQAQPRIVVPGVQ